jgi:hypothetical protein
MGVEAQPGLTRYAVVFSAGQEQSTAGALMVGADGLLLVGGTAADRVELRIPYTELTAVRVGRSPQERLNGHPALLLGRAGKPTVRITALGAGFLGEIADLLALLATAPTATSESVAVIVPLRKGSLAQAQALIVQGPPFDPAALGFTQHQVLLSAHAAIFVFRGPHARATLERASRDPTLWRVGLKWRRCIAGRPRLTTKPDTYPANAQLVYSWPANNQQA